DSVKLAALVGPPAGTPPAGISTKVLILDGATGQRTTVDLPAPASILLAGLQGGRGLLAALPGDPPRVASINTDTGEVQVLQGGAGFGLPGGGGGGGGLSVNVDGLTHVVSTPVRLSGNRTTLVVADDDINPTKALFVVLSGSG